ncbi:hypothetical protein [Natronorubrum bangense]|uniref:Uncharacterized protein n=2 Tax=Natronorubrum bangense TaxID=61858 RepID=L9WKC9_9EURY|nr:hypothetical protein [Natronorubrum bangense]ELY49909.1 hypothetical protein C494_07860 [Natronorubrum bangense JCM 10635]QCC55526.1 hypothetical protein DV706_14235 [Natronorubrum bangense]
MKEYNSETGQFVVVDVDGNVIGKADVGSGTHPVSDEVDTEKSFDVLESENEHVAEYLEYSPANANLNPGGVGGKELLDQIMLDTQSVEDEE